MAMSAERHRALRLLAGAPLGATEAIMLTHGFTHTMLDALVRDGFTQIGRAMMVTRSRSLYRPGADGSVMSLATVVV
jgi:hypothetical protein